MGICLSAPKPQPLGEELLSSVTPRQVSCLSICPFSKPPCARTSRGFPTGTFSAAAAQRPVLLRLPAAQHSAGKASGVWPMMGQKSRGCGHSSGQTTSRTALQLGADARMAHERARIDQDARSYHAQMRRRRRRRTTRHRDEVQRWLQKLGCTRSASPLCCRAGCMAQTYTRRTVRKTRVQEPGTRRRLWSEGTMPAAGQNTLR